VLDFFTSWMPFLLPNQQYQRTEDKVSLLSKHAMFEHAELCMKLMWAAATRRMSFMIAS